MLFVFMQLMDNIKDDNYYLRKIATDLQILIGHTKGKSYKEVEADLVLIDSTMFRLVQIAENSDKLTPFSNRNTRSCRGEKLKE